MTAQRAGRRAAVVGAIVAVLAIAGGACSGGGSRTGSQMSARSGLDTAASDTAGGTAAGRSAGNAAAVGRSAQAVVAQPLSAAKAAAAPAPAPPAVANASLDQSKVVKTAVIHVEVRKGRFAKQFSEAATIASTYGGFVSSSTSAAGDDKHLDAGTLVLRIRADQFDEARRQLRKLGTVKSEELSGEDVGGQLADLDARLRNLRAQEEAIRALMAKAKDVNETLTVQNQLSGVREQIETLAAQQARLNDQVVYATVTVNIAEPGVAIDEPARGGIAAAWHKAVDGAEAVLAGTIVALGYLLPLALLALAIALGARAALRARPAPVTATASASEHGA